MLQLVLVYIHYFVCQSHSFFFNFLLDARCVYMRRNLFRLLPRVDAQKSTIPPSLQQKPKRNNDYRPKNGPILARLDVFVSGGGKIKPSSTGMNLTISIVNST